MPFTDVTARSARVHASLRSRAAIAPRSLRVSAALIAASLVLGPAPAANAADRLEAYATWCRYHAPNPQRAAEYWRCRHAMMEVDRRRAALRQREAEQRQYQEQQRQREIERAQTEQRQREIAHAEQRRREEIARQAKTAAAPADASQANTSFWSLVWLFVTHPVAFILTPVFVAAYVVPALYAGQRSPFGADLPDDMPAFVTVCALVSVSLPLFFQVALKGTFFQIVEIVGNIFYPHPSLPLLRGLLTVLAYLFFGLIAALLALLLTVITGLAAALVLCGFVVAFPFFVWGVITGARPAFYYLFVRYPAERILKQELERPHQLDLKVLADHLTPQLGDLSNPKRADLSRHYAERLKALTEEFGARTDLAEAIMKHRRAHAADKLDGEPNAP